MVIEILEYSLTKRISRVDLIHVVVVLVVRVMEHLALLQVYFLGVCVKFNGILAFIIYWSTNAVEEPTC